MTVDCGTLENHLDDYLDGLLDAAVRHRCEAHLRDCPACRERVAQERRLRAALRELPVEAPSSGFEERVLRAAAAAHHRRARGAAWWYGAGFGSAAAGLILWLLAAFWPGGLVRPPAAGAAAHVQVFLDRPRELRVVLDAPEDLPGVNIRVSVPEGVELLGHRGRRRLQWQADLRRGRNVLVLPVVVHAAPRGMLELRLEQGSERRAVRVRFELADEKERRAAAHVLGA